MQSESEKFLRKLVELLKKTILIVILAPIFSAAIFYGINISLERLQNTQLINSNFSKIRIGMTSAQVEFLLGWPDAVYQNAEDKSLSLPRSQLSSWFRVSRHYYGVRTDDKGVPINTQGREVWIYQNSKYPPLYAPGIIFDVKTGRVIQLTKVMYDE